jgi:hypothetical protein
LKRGIDRDVLTSVQREVLAHLRCIFSNIESRFYKTYGMEIEDARTVHAACAFRLVLEDGKPSVCLMKDWVTLSCT